MPVPAWTQRTCLWMARGLMMTLRIWQIITNCLWGWNVSPWICPFRLLCMLCMLQLRNNLLGQYMDHRSGSLFTQTPIATIWPWAWTVLIYASTNTPSLSTFMSGSQARPVMCIGPSSWTSWHFWGPVPGTRINNVPRHIGCMIKRHQACLRQTGAVMARCPFAVCLSSAGTLRDRTSCPARACGRRPMKPIAGSWP